MTQSQDPRPVVTQEDREAAADLIAWHNTAAGEWHIEGGSDLRYFAASLPEGMRQGGWDEHPVTQAFARHRIAALSRQEASGEVRCTCGDPKHGHGSRCPTLAHPFHADGRPKIAPVQGYSPGIPWEMHLRAYDAYRARWSEQAALIDIEKRGCRGGFGTKELDGFIPGWREELAETTKLKARIAELEVALSAQPLADAKPIPMLLWCPQCHLQHVDEPDERTPDWDNPPHKSHLCHGCGCIWRPADVTTEGVANIQTKGKADTFDASTAPDELRAEGDVLRAAVNQNDAMRQELAHVGNLVSDLARAMRVDQADDDGGWPDLSGRVKKLIAAALARPDRMAEMEAKARWRHKVRGTEYDEIGAAELQASKGPVEEGAILVLYRGDDGKVWARRASEFGDGRFERAALSASEGGR